MSKTRRMFRVTDKRLVCVLRSGIGNRLVHLASAMRIAESLDRPLRAFWPRSGVGADYHQLFEPLAHHEVISVDREPRAASLLAGGSWLWVRADEAGDDYRKPYPDQDIGGYTIGVHRPGFKLLSDVFDIGDALRDTYVEYFKRLTPVVELRQALARRRTEIMQGVVMGGHLRRGDMLHKLRKAGLEHLASAEGFLAIFGAVLDADPSARIFLATNCAESRDRILRAMPEHVVTSHNDNPERDATSRAKSAVLDIFSLAACPRLLLSIGTFGQCAWWFGGCPPVRRVAGYGSHNLIDAQ